MTVSAAAEAAATPLPVRAHNKRLRHCCSWFQVHLKLAWKHRHRFASCSSLGRPRTHSTLTAVAAACLKRAECGPQRRHKLRGLLLCHRRPLLRQAESVRHSWHVASSVVMQVGVQSAQHESPLLGGFLASSQAHADWQRRGGPLPQTHAYQQQPHLEVCPCTERASHTTLDHQAPSGALPATSSSHISGCGHSSAA